MKVWVVYDRLKPHSAPVSPGTKESAQASARLFNARTGDPGRFYAKFFGVTKAHTDRLVGSL